MRAHSGAAARTVRALACAAAALCVQATASGQDAAPAALVRSVTDDVIAVVKQDGDIRAGNTRKTIALVEQKVVPHFDFRRMTELAVGASWRKATPDQQQTLVDEFRTLLVRTYSTALSAYRNQTIEVKPLRAAGDAEAVVRSEVKQSGTQPVTIDYSMAKSPAGWKVYDVAVGGVSLVTTYRDTFATEVRAGGIDGLITSIAEKNRSLAAKSG
jgi:phospholipid transport system substrate-binding protein